MAFFKNKEEKEDAAIEKLKERFHLESMSHEDFEIVSRIVSDLSGNAFLKAGMALSFARAEDQATVSYLSALVEQNWLIFRKLDEISKKLDDFI